ncbi:MAG: DUF169 domain-containing protein [Elusimicrobia bacterium]|nr:DUF169 domain-containing protein [Elusimicrobiota bacterium]
MDMLLKEKFMAGWEKYFPGAELPVGFYYTDKAPGPEYVRPPAGHQCMIGVLNRARRGEALSFDAGSIGCFGGKRYAGFRAELAPNFEYFLSCGIPGKLEGERYKKSPELVAEMMKAARKFAAPGKYIVFKRFDTLAEGDEPDAAVFFAPPDVLAGLFTLANFDGAEPDGVICPFSAGCGSIIQYPYQEKGSARPRAVLGMFDVSARPFVEKGVLTFAVPMEKLARMTGSMDESFLITGSWEKVKARLKA